MVINNYQNFGIIKYGKLSNLFDYWAETSIRLLLLKSPTPKLTIPCQVGLNVLLISEHEARKIEK